MKKKCLLFTIALACMFAMISCGGASTPSSAAKQIISSMQSGDTDAVVDGLDITSEKDKEQMRAMMNEKIKESEKGTTPTIKSYSILGEQISEDGTKAEVEAEFVYSDGSTKSDKLKFVLNEQGEWKMKLK